MVGTVASQLRVRVRPRQVLVPVNPGGWFGCKIRVDMPGGCPTPLGGVQSVPNMEATGRMRRLACGLSEKEPKMGRWSGSVRFSS